MAISKVRLPNNTTQDIHDARITGVDSSPTSSSGNVVTSGGVYTMMDGKKIWGGTEADYNLLTPDADTLYFITESSSYTQKSSVVGTEMILVSSTEYITPSQIAGMVEADTPVESSQPAGGFLPNVVYDLGTLSGTITFSLASPSDNTIANPYHWTFETSSTIPTITWPSGLTWAGGSAPTINANKHYEITARNGYATALEF